jgi:putative ABC transport system substrate-binding protein
MIRKVSYLTLGPLLLALSFSAQAQQRGKVYRIGFLRAAPAPEPYLEAFRRGLRELGYTEGQNVSFEYRWANGKADQLPNLAADLVRLKVDLIVTDATVAALPAKKATSTIPIVMASSTVPIESGLIASLAHPAGNITGLTSLAGELGGKLLELLKEIVPKIARVAIVRPLKSPADDLFVKEVQSPARVLGIQLMVFAVPGPDDYESAFHSAVKERAHALFVRGSPFTSPDQRKRIAEWAARSRLPAIYEIKEFVEAGGLVSYAADRVEMWRRAATYVDKILKGTKPADLPVEQPTKFEFIINLKTAKQIGLTIPPNVLARADKVIK